MATIIRWVLSDDRTHLRRTERGEEIEDGVATIRVALPGDEEHVIVASPPDPLDIHVHENGTLEILTRSTREIVRRYGSWAWVEQTPWKNRPRTERSVILH